MIANTKELEAVIDGIMKPRGFNKRRSAWYQHHPETVLVLDLQNSDYGGQYYVNLAIAIRALNPGEYPREEICHIRMRVDDVVDDAGKVSKAFDLEDKSLTSHQRSQQIRETIGRASQWLERLSTVRAIVQELSSNESLRNRSTVQVRRYLNIN